MRPIKNILSTQLFKISSLNTLSVLVRVAGGLVASKVIALFLGPAGLAAVGNFRNFLALLDTVSTLGFQNGIIKYTAENQHDEPKIYRVLATSFISIFLVILVVSGILVLAAGYWNSWIFSEGEDYSWVFKVVAFSLPWYAGNILLMAVINGLGKYKEVIIINIWGNIAGVLLSAVLIWKFHTSGALLGLILSPAFLFLFSFYLLIKQFPGFRFLKRKYFDFDVFRGLLSYSVMSLVTAVLANVISLFIRNSIINNYGDAEAGFWEAINRIAVFYLMFISTLISVYFLPKLSMANSTSESKDIFKTYYKGIVPLFIGAIIVIYFLREFVVKLIFSPDFLPVTNLFFWQLLGDLLKVCSLIFACQFIAKKMTAAYIVSEVLSYGVLYLSSIFLIEKFGAEGAVMAHAFTYFIYLSGVLLFFRKQLK